MAETTTRAYTLKLSGAGNWQEFPWKTHVAVNRATWGWGDWLLTLRGGLAAGLANDQSILPITDEVVEKELKRRKLNDDARATLRSELEQARDLNLKVLLALSWLSVESPASLAPGNHIVASGKETPAERQHKIRVRFCELLDRLLIPPEQQQQWLDACEPALTARIRDDAVWVDRSLCFADLQKTCPGLTADWAATTLFGFLGGVDSYFTMPNTDESASAEAKDSVQKAGGWLSRNWGTGKKSDAGAISTTLLDLVKVDLATFVGKSAHEALRALLAAAGHLSSDGDSVETSFKQLKQAIGWKGRSSKGAIALEKIRDCQMVSAQLWQQVADKLSQEATEQSTKAGDSTGPPAWMHDWRRDFERRLGIPYRTTRDLIWEHGVALDHALRRVSASHTWIKRAEVERRRFKIDAAKINDVAKVPAAAKDWLDGFCEWRSTESGAEGDYFIRKRAIDGWDKIVQAWAELEFGSTRQQRINASRDVQKNLDDNEKFGDIQLFAGFGDDDEPDQDRKPCLADNAASCVWHDVSGKPSSQILKDYVAATIAEHDQRRFKVPTYRHPDPLRHPVFVDYGNSRWNITYSALKTFQQREKHRDQLPKAKTEKARTKLRQQLDAPLDLHGVDLEIWNGEDVDTLPLRWVGARFEKDLNLDKLDANASGPEGNPVTRADRLGRIVAGQPPQATVSIAAVFAQKDWNGRLQAPREQLDRLADLVYGKLDGKWLAPDYEKLDRIYDDPRTHRLWKHLRWFLTTSAKLQPQGPWLDYVAKGLPDGIHYKKGRNGYYLLNYEVNNGRKGRARLLIARLPKLRILSFDLGHRYGVACAIWETMSREQMIAACRAAGHAEPTGGELYIHLSKPTNKVQKSGRRKGQLVTETSVYRRIGPDKVPDGSDHPAPWARLERQFVIRLQGEDRPARLASEQELDTLNRFRKFLGLRPVAGRWRVNDLHTEALQIARRGLRRLGDAARIAFAMTATSKPISGGREVKLSEEADRIRYVQDALVLWQALAKSPEYDDAWAAEQWQSWIVEKFGGPQPVEISDDIPRSERNKRIEATRKSLLKAATQLANHESKQAVELHRLWREHWRELEAQWRRHLRQLRKLILPRATDWKANRKSVRQVGGLSVQRLQAIRNLYQLLKAFRMRPEPDDPRKNVPALGDESLANFGRRILNQLERLREQRIKQLASRVIEAALGAGRMQNKRGRDRKRPVQGVDRACHMVVAEDLENYRPEESRLRRVNHRLMDWAARNVRKYIAEGCELHGLHFVEVSPRYTSLQDSRTGAPGIRCEDVPREILEQAIERLNDTSENNADGESTRPETLLERDIRRWTSTLRRIDQQVQANKDLDPREQIFLGIWRTMKDTPKSVSTIRLPRRGGDLFVSAAANSPTANGLQADLNAAANIGLKALMDPDWWGAWWFVLINLATGQPIADKIHGCLWDSAEITVTLATGEDRTSKRAQSSTKRAKTSAYAWNPRFWPAHGTQGWAISTEYWNAVEKGVAERLLCDQTESENPF